MSLQQQYIERLPKLREAAKRIRQELLEFLEGTPRIDAVAARAKTTERFLAKATKLGSDGQLKYDNPLDDIQDQIGARIIVFYKSDVDAVSERIERNYRLIERQKREAPDPGLFGYEAKHYVCSIPLEIRQATDCPVQFFELQISTLFQHAWSEANHDLGYKSDAPMDYEKKRKIALAAAQSWGADMIFDEMFRERPPTLTSDN